MTHGNFPRDINGLSSRDLRPAGLLSRNSRGCSTCIANPHFGSFWFFGWCVPVVPVHISANKNDETMPIFFTGMHMQVPLLPLLPASQRRWFDCIRLLVENWLLIEPKILGCMGYIYISGYIYIYTYIHPDLPIVSPMAWLSHVITSYHHLRWYLPLRWAMGDRLATGLLL